LTEISNGNIFHPNKIKEGIYFGNKFEGKFKEIQKDG